MQDFEQITKSEQNRLARLYPFYFEHVPDKIPFPLLFGPDYDVNEESALVELLKLKGQSVQKVHEHGTELNRQTVLSSYYLEKRRKKIQARKNFEARKRAGAVAPGSLGIVGSNLDTCNTSPCEKETRAGLYKAQNMIQKIRLGPDPERITLWPQCNTDLPAECNTNPSRDWPCPQRFEPIPLKRPIVSKTVCDCGRPLRKDVIINRNKEHGSGSVSGVATCGSVWACPVCRAKIVSKRSEELKELYQAWKERDGHVYMITLTVPHSKEDNLAELYGSNHSGTGLTGALDKFRSSRTFSKDFKDRAGYFGDLRGIEVTWGKQNGFHPHIHLLVFTEETIGFKEWRTRLYMEWRNACLKAGLKEPSWEHGIDLSYCDEPESAQYIAKWSAATELTSESMKEAKHGNFSIAELERCLWDKEYRNARKIGLRKIATVLRAYYGAMHGQRMLQPGGISENHNWKKELLEITEEDETDTEHSEPVADLEYRAYIKIKRADQLPSFLEASERGRTNTERLDSMRCWLQNHGYRPDAVKCPYQNSPPPLAFSYQTGYEEKFFNRQKIYRA